VSGSDAQACRRRHGEDHDEEDGARACREKKAGRSGCAVSHSGLDVSLPSLLLYYTLTEIEWPSYIYA
jgi:hypothetical protein